ncbi:formylglycine-generating enzyme family protein [Gillisia limnaea]|uniref:Sulphatase-modifying factor protein n=1 Tax=Gillisia limnaea (strain DSM 15749 / LMG 21470 / R-8282) TaxID=865937 RepID=H2BR51_GILLR|nr:formylglycine-generating enzyme family protein [Gillisia limnaea]EHQ04370.1 Sulphatase-modifying factor protein [Gillisia limnaea DSM 15749]
MLNSKLNLVLLTAIWFLSQQFFAQEQKEDMAYVKGGSYIPLYGADSVWVKVDDFLLDPYPVTNAEFLKFVHENSEWKKSGIKKLFADERYLYNWKSDYSLGENVSEKAPVTNVSWFAAKRFCECQGKRLPTLDEWEYAAMADEDTPDARVKESYNQKILSWYETPKTFENNVGSTFKNYWGVYDLHGLVWEWTLDFNAVLLSGESRNDSDTDRNLFCGSGSVGATDLMNYAALMRYAFRGSIKARYSIKNLGFRCARDAQSL